MSRLKFAITNVIRTESENNACKVGNFTQSVDFSSEILELLYAAGQATVMTFEREGGPQISLERLQKSSAHYRCFWRQDCFLKRPHSLPPRLAQVVNLPLEDSMPGWRELQF